jgi:outer membrane protein OmpA-like peptidoglycan-associated protein
LKNQPFIFQQTTTHIMRQKLFTIIILTLILQQIILGQPETYKISLAPISSKNHDEFSPAYYKEGIVFCSKRSTDVLLDHSGFKNNKQSEFYYFNTTGKTRSVSAGSFSNDLKNNLNNGPATFNTNGDTIYYSRNLDLNYEKSNKSGRGIKLGIFNAVMVKGNWTKIREFRYNDDRYNLTTPCLSPDGKKLFFSSDRPGGSGGYDLYYCRWKGDYWDKPVNLGPEINTTGNESFPFINPYGDLFFSSDGQPGLGGMDIFYSQYLNQEWHKPVRLDPPINSSANDFGIITDSIMNSGYFSSDRNKSLDIFQFKTDYSQVFYNTIQKDMRDCFVFRDTGSIAIDTAYLRYMWNFGDGKSSAKITANHCFDGPGDYNVKLNIIEKSSGRVFFPKLSYKLIISDFEQPFINSSDAAVKNEIIFFDGLKSYLPGFKILSYSWDFGDNHRSQGANVDHTYLQKGEYLVNLGLTLKSVSTGKLSKTGISKKIIVLNNYQEKVSYLTAQTSAKSVFHDLSDFENVKITTLYSAENEFRQDASFVVELMTSDKQIALNNNIFRKVPKKYRISENLYADTAVYSYNVDKQINLMATYPAYREMTALGFKEARIKIYLLSDQSEKELLNVIKINGSFADPYFDSSEKLTTDAYVMLDQIFKLMTKYPPMKLEVAVHTDNLGMAENNLEVSQRHSQYLADYLIKRGINTKRMVPRGFGGSKPIASNILEKDRRLNRRIDFLIIN